jgi:hypothetical protein
MEEIGDVPSAPLMENAIPKAIVANPINETSVFSKLLFYSYLLSPS